MLPFPESEQDLLVLSVIKTNISIFIVLDLVLHLMLNEFLTAFNIYLKFVACVVLGG